MDLLTSHFRALTARPQVGPVGDRVSNERRKATSGRVNVTSASAQEGTSGETQTDKDICRLWCCAKGNNYIWYNYRLYMALMNV